MSEERKRQNGVTMPREGSKTRRPWDIATAISEEKERPATREEVLSKCDEEGISKGTAATQYSHWKKYYGLIGRVSKPANVAPATPPLAKAANAAQAKPAPTKAETPPPTEPSIAGGHAPGENCVPNDGSTKEYDEGWDAYCEGKSAVDCPYERGSNEAGQWNDGFDDATKA